MTASQMTPEEIGASLAKDVLDQHGAGAPEAVSRPIYGTDRKRRSARSHPTQCCIERCDRPAKGRGWCNKHYVRFIKHGHPLSGGSYRPAPGVVSATIAAALAYQGDDCQKWPFASNGAGYGQAVIDGEKQYVHRYVCAKVNGPPPRIDDQAAHSCGMGHEGCITPRHLSWKSPIGNSIDQAVHGTRIRGSRVGSAKVSEDAVRVIRSRLIEGVQQKQLAKDFGLKQSSISAIANGRTWAWLA